MSPGTEAGIRAAVALVALGSIGVGVYLLLGLGFALLVSGCLVWADLVYDRVRVARAVAARPGAKR